MKLVFILVSLLCLLFNHQASGQVAKDINVARIAIDDQSLASQKKAGKRAFSQVLVKMSGDPSVLEVDTLQTAANNFEQYLIASSYVQQNAQLYYQARFSQEKIIDLLQYTGSKIWGGRRPQSLIWLAVEDLDQSRHIVMQNSDANVIAELQQHAFSRGVELVFPLGDLDDATSVSIYDVWGGFTQVIFQASNRYQVNYVVTAKLYKGFDDFSASEKTLLEWTITDGTEVYQSTVASDSVEQAYVAFINQYADYLANKFAFDSNAMTAPQGQVITIKGINSLQHYADVMTLLNSLTVVNDVELVSQWGNTSQFSLSMSVDLPILLQVLALEDQLVLDESSAVETTQQPHFLFVP